MLEYQQVQTVGKLAQPEYGSWLRCLYSGLNKETVIDATDKITKKIEVILLNTSRQPLECIFKSTV